MYNIIGDDYMKKDFQNFINNLNNELERKDLNITKLYIGYKLIIYANNNDFKMTNDSLLEFVNKIYKDYLEDDDVDIYDELINEYFNKAD